MEGGAGDDFDVFREGWRHLDENENHVDELALDHLG